MLPVRMVHDSPRSIADFGCAPQLGGRAVSLVPRTAHNAGMGFKNHFSAQAAEYARFRPRYPAALFEWLASVAPGRALAWDCGTGNGQAAVALAVHFGRVVASDPSAEQIAHAELHPRVQYFVAAAEAPPGEARGADLVTVAQALHWFDFDRFYSGLEGVLGPGGVLAAWGYGLMGISPAVDAVVLDYYSRVVGPWWPPDRAHIESGYRSIPFPLDEMAVPTFAMSARWNLDALMGYLDTWSATRRYRVARGEDPLLALRPVLAAAWGEGELERDIEWPLFLRVGRRPLSIRERL